MDNIINWVDAFKDEEFTCKLREFIEEVLADNTATNEDIDEIFAYDEKTETLTFNKGLFKLNSSDETEDSKEQLTEEDMEKATQSLRLMLLYLLMKDNGLELDKNNMSADKSYSKKQEHRGNGKKAAELMATVTGIPLQTCKNFIVNPGYSSRGIKDIITKINKILIDLDLKIRL